MRLPASFGLLTLLLALVAAQSESPDFPACTRELAETDECLAVINPNACYNQFRWSARTLSCIDAIDGTPVSEDVKKQWICKCCNCVGAVMCNWAARSRFC
ncbi:hypothetical protein VTJ49DRAFT_4304 [Mycothermus thermophilus]|uniref:Uncharacterized protein n=1 Tax=Humicola insolens TaxID=85995 RepID=A0ABR3V6N1_HUMIN